MEDPRSLLAKALGQRVPVKVIAVEKGRLKGIPLALRALSQNELQECRRAANTRMVEALAWKDENLFTEAGEEDSATEYATQVLAVALVDPPGTDVASPRDARCVVGSADELRKLLTKQEVALLWSMWVDYEIERSPLSVATEWSDVEATLEALGKAKVTSYCLHGFSTVSLRFMLTELAVRLYSTRTNSPSSGTSPSSEQVVSSSDASDSTTDPAMTIE